MFKDHNITPGAFNVICAPITELKTEKSETDNGYYVVSGLWGTCFHRIATKKSRFEIHGNADPRCPHTYTKIPAHLAPKTFFVYVNYKEGSGYKITLNLGDIVVGMHEAQPHVTGGWRSQSCLIYSPTGQAPIVEETGFSMLDTSLYTINYKGENSILTVERITEGHSPRFIALSEEGYYQPKKTSRE